MKLYSRERGLTIVYWLGNGMWIAPLKANMARQVLAEFCVITKDACTLAKFAAPVGIRDSNETEFLAIVLALELSIGKEWLKH